MNQPIRTCRACGCTEDCACHNMHDGPCWWVEDSLCSHCQLTAAALGSEIQAADRRGGFLVPLPHHHALQLQKMTTWLLGLPTSTTIDQIHAGVLALLAKQNEIADRVGVRPPIMVQSFPMDGTVFDPEN